jgi:hypothetical protein
MRRGAIAIVVVSVMACAALLAPAVGANRPGGSPYAGGSHAIRAPWEPNVKAARRYAQRRTGDVRFAVIDLAGRMDVLHGARTSPMASLFKALLLATYLSRPDVRDRALHGWERDLLGPMIMRSDNAAATRVRDMLGAGPIVAMARRADMHDFTYNSVWGLSRTSARDQARFFYRWDHFVPKRHEDYARYLLSHIISSQRWGLAKARPRGWKIFFKGGWGVGSGRVNHQTAFLERHRCRIAISVMTEFSPNHSYGTQTQRGVGERLLKGIRRADCRRRHR